MYYVIDIKQHNFLLLKLNKDGFMGSKMGKTIHSPFFRWFKL